VTPLLSTALLRTQSDARLASLAHDGHELAFEAIVERYRKPLHAYCRRVLPDARAEDVVQQTFLSAWTALQRADEVRDLRAWLYRIAHNTSINNLKRAGYDYDELRDSLEHGDTPQDDLERRTVIRETLAGVAALPERQREALLRTAVGDGSQAEIARDLGLTDGAVRQLVHRARTTLRTAATAITPFPMAAWAATATGGVGGAPVSERIAELAAGAGTAGVGSLLFKGGAAVVVAGAVAATPVAVHHTRAADEARGATPAMRTTEDSGPSSGSGATPVSTTLSSGNADDNSGRGGGSDDQSGDDHSGRGRGGDDGEDRSGRGGGDDGANDDHGDSRKSGDRDDHNASGRSGGEEDHHESGKSRDEDHSGSRKSGGDDDGPDKMTRDDSSGSEGSPDEADRTDDFGSGKGSDDSGSGDHSGSDDPEPHD